MLSDARSEMKYARIQKQKMKTWPSVNQKDRFTLIALNSTCRSQVYENSRREQIMLHAELDNRERERERESSSGNSYWNSSGTGSCEKFAVLELRDLNK